MRFTPRMRQIFQVLLKEPSAISVRQLAEQIGVSRRTVQRIRTNARENRNIRV